jgi:Sec-independent protein translocase protein TatA
MKMNIDEPRLTAYSLDELDEAERSTIARAIADCPEAQRFVASTQQFARALRSQYGYELEKELISREKFVAIHDDSFWSKAGPLAIAAVLAVLAVIGAVVLGTNRLSGIAGLAGSSSGKVADARSAPPVEAEEAAQPNQNPSREADAGPYAYTGERPFVSVWSRPLSSFPVLVSSASYLNVRSSINAGVLPSRDAVRVEGMINHFPYEYPQPAEHEPFSLNVDVVTCPWEPAHRLVRIGLKSGEATTITGDSRIEVEFNPRRVASYRLIGYDRRPSGEQNVSQGKVGTDRIATGYTVTAFYEAIPLRQRRTTADTRTPSFAGQPADLLLSAKLQFRTRANDAVQFIERVVRDTGSAFDEAPQDLKFAAAVAEFGMILRDSEYRGNGTLQQVLEWAQEGKGADANGYRTDFIELVRKAQALKRG